MPFFMIKGTFHIKGYSPDGDSIRFKATHRANWQKLAGAPVSLNAREHAQLRFEGIDTLETHYNGFHQPMKFAIQARDYMLHELGIRDIVTDETGTVTSAHDGTPGYILARTTEKYRRPVAFVFAGHANEADGAEIFLKPDQLRHSVNAHLAEAGLAYPTYYQGLFNDLRATLTHAVTQARGAHRGFWPDDKTTSGVDVEDLTTITDQAVILPKLFRRLVAYLEAGGNLDGFKAYLEGQAEPILILSQMHFTHLDTVVSVNGNTVALEVPPEDLVFLE